MAAAPPEPEAEKLDPAVVRTALILIVGAMAVIFDTTRKLLDTRRLTELGWAPKIGLEAGIRSTYEWFLNNRASLKT